MDVGQRFAAQLLTGRKAQSVGKALEHLVAVQGQEVKAFRFNVRVRTAGVRSSDVAASLATGEAVVSWVNRGTLHLVRSQDLPWLHVVTTPQLATASARRLAQEGVSPDEAARGVELMATRLADGPATRAELKAVLEARNIPVARQAHVHILVKACLEGVLVRGPLVGAEQQFVLRRDWLPGFEVVDRGTALGVLGPRYLRSHPDATPADLAKWAGITLGDARRALADVPVPEVVSLGLPAPTLLGPWDEVLLGWVDRTWVLGGRPDLITVNGIFKALVLVEGRAVGTWGVPGGSVALDLFHEQPPEVMAAIDAEARAVEAFLAG